MQSLESDEGGVLLNQENMVPVIPAKYDVDKLPVVSENDDVNDLPPPYSPPRYSQIIEIASSPAEIIEIASSPAETSRHFAHPGEDPGSDLMEVYSRLYPGAVSGQDFIPLSTPQNPDSSMQSVPEPEPWSPPPPPAVPLSEEQNRIVQQILAGGNAFFTGPAGSGKSLIVAHLKHAFDYPSTPENFDQTGDNWRIWCEEHRTRYAVTAPTGIAAVLIGGSTIHSWSGVGLGRNGLTSYLSSFRPPGPGNKASYRVKPWLVTDVLILDEVSMLGPDLLELLNAIGKNVRGVPGKPFGGIQVVCSGDFFQLPPVEPDSSRKCAMCGM